MSFKDLTTKAAALLKSKSAEPSEKDAITKSVEAGSKPSDKGPKSS